jgi:hypothetical protein
VFDDVPILGDPSTASSCRVERQATVGDVVEERRRRVIEAVPGGRRSTEVRA